MDLITRIDKREPITHHMLLVNLPTPTEMAYFKRLNIRFLPLMYYPYLSQLIRKFKVNVPNGYIAELCINMAQLTDEELLSLLPDLVGGVISFKGISAKNMSDFFVASSRYRELTVMIALYDWTQLRDLIKKYPATSILAKPLVDTLEEIMPENTQ
jgi:hypothetical protein